jgi:hypothetical protein
MKIEEWEIKRPKPSYIKTRKLKKKDEIKFKDWETEFNRQWFLTSALLSDRQREAMRDFIKQLLKKYEK